jgi:hypothetical protein
MPPRPRNRTLLPPGRETIRDAEVVTEPDALGELVIGELP